MDNETIKGVFPKDTVNSSFFFFFLELLLTWLEYIETVIWLNISSYFFLPHKDGD